MTLTPAVSVFCVSISLNFYFYFLFKFICICIFISILFITFLFLNMDSLLCDLARVVMRLFYEDKYILFIEFLLANRMMSDDQLAIRFHTNVKEINKISAKLRDDKIIKAETRLESPLSSSGSIHQKNDGMGMGIAKRGGMGMENTSSISSNMHQQHRVWYYIDWPLFIDQTRWRIWKMKETIEIQLGSTLEGREYECISCHRGFGIMEISKMQNKRTGTIQCPNCSGDIEEATLIQNSMENQNLMTVDKMMDELDPLQRLLQNLENVKLAPFSPIEWLKQRENLEIHSSVSSSSLDSPVSETQGKGGIALSQSEESVSILSEGVGGGSGMMGGMKGLEGGIISIQSLSTSSSISSQSINIEMADESKTVDGEGERGKKKEPEMPIWYSHSTITGERIHKDKFREKEELLAPLQGIKTEEKRIKIDNSNMELITVAGEPRKIDQITDQDIDRMTEDEYVKYYKIKINTSLDEAA